MLNPKRTYRRTVKFGLVAALVAGTLSGLFAFQSTGRESFGAGAFAGGVVTLNLKIRHTPLVKCSPVTQQLIILGEAGDEVPPKPPAFKKRLTPQSDFGPIENRQLRVKIEYRYVPSLEQADGVPISTLPVIEGTDPIAFAFQITPSSITVGFLQYRIVAERLQYVAGDLLVVGQNTFPVTSPADPNPFITVGIQANASQVFGAEGGTFALPDGNPEDAESTIEMPAGLLGGPTTITLDEIETSNPTIPPGLSNPVAIYRLDSDQRIRGNLKVSLLYRDFEFPQGPDGVVDGTNIPVGNLALVWWDGFMWRRLGGVVNTQSNTVSAKIGFLSYMAIVAAPPLSPEDRRPMEKVFTPNGDGKNDSIIFSFGDRPEDVPVNIFDITGHQIRTLHSQSSMEWDGRDDSGRIVESGVYIYQYEIDGKRISGVCAVAK